MRQQPPRQTSRVIQQPKVVSTGHGLFQEEGTEMVDITLSRNNSDDESDDDDQPLRGPNSKPTKAKGFTMKIDLNGDGKANIFAVDSTGDGKINHLDLNMDGQPNMILKMPVTMQELNTNLRKSVGLNDFTVGGVKGNALTYRSFVDPREVRPDIANYDRTNQTSRRYPMFQESDLESGKSKEKENKDVVRNKSDDEDDDTTVEEESTGQQKFGTWDGVFTSCLLNIFGVIMFLRLGWVTGQAGVPLTILIVTIATVVTTITTSSMSAMATNGKVGSGGVYFLISRAIGPEIGGAIGVLLAIGLSVATALYTIGFCEALVDQIGPVLTGTAINDIRIWGVILMLIILGMCLIGTAWVIKLQFMLLMLLIGAIATIFIGSFVSLDVANGVVGYDGTTLAKNMSPAFLDFNGQEYGFFSTFAIFFPAVTGIMAGANISGDLKNPSEAIPKGTFSAILISWFTYSGLAVVCGAVGRVVVEGNDKAGLVFDTLWMTRMAWLEGSLVYAGIYAATFSSALASLVGAPRVLQKLAEDGIIPFLEPFAVVRESDSAPIRGYFAAAIIGIGCVLLGELNLVAPLITMFFMLTYGMINIACFMLSISDSPSWRPSFKYYHWSTSLLGGILCIGIMFCTDKPAELGAAFASFVIMCLLYKYIEKKAIPVNWGAAGGAIRTTRVVRALLDLKSSQKHVKHYRPHFLVLTGVPTDEPDLVNLMSTATGGTGLCTFAEVVLQSFEETFGAAAVDQTDEDKRARIRTRKEVLQKLHEGYYTSERTMRSFSALTECVVAPSLRQGAQSLMMMGGVGRLRSNTLVLGFKERWRDATKEDRKDYVDVLRDAFRLQMGVVLTRGLHKLKFKASSTELKAQGKGRMDLWWLADDGGLCVLFCHILMMHDFWKAQINQVRLIVVVRNKEGIVDLMLLMGQLLTQFRLKWQIEIIEGGKRDQEIQPLVTEYNAMADEEASKHARPAVCKRWLHVARLIRDNSEDAKLGCVLMPFPSDEDLDGNFLAMLEMLSSSRESELPPMILVRGSGESVLTFQSE